MDRDTSTDDGHEGILGKAKDAIENLTGGAAGSAEQDNRVQDGAIVASDRSNAVNDPMYSGGTVGIGSADSAATGRDGAVDYSSEMGGGAPDTNLSAGYDEHAGVRSVYDPATDKPGSSGDADSNRDETGS